MNKTILIGNVANDPELRQTSSGVSCCTFRMATQRRFTDPQTGKREADFHTVTAWRQLGELCAKYLVKGSKCAVEGTIQYHSYTGKDGIKRFVTQIIADNVEFLSKQDGGAQQERNDGFTEVEIGDELPF